MPGDRGEPVGQHHDGSPVDGWLVYAPMRAEAAALHAGAAVRRTGTGPRRAQLAAAALAAAGSGTGGRSAAPAPALAVAGIGGGLHEELRPGDVVVASQVRLDPAAGDGPLVVDCPAAPLLAAALRRRDLTVHIGPVVSSAKLVRRGADRARLAEGGALVADTESAWLLAGTNGHRARACACVRVIADTPPGGLIRPATLARVGTALAVLPEVGAALAEWGAATTVRTVLLAAPRSFCAGVERAITVVERALERYGPPVYVRKQIVHNVHVVADLRRRGAVFVDDVTEVPPGAVTVFSAHGVAPAVRDEAAGRGLSVIDATCPLVTKVHTEARRFAGRGHTVLLVGHAGHEETDGTIGEAPDRVRLVQTVREAERVEVEDPERVSYLLQTTLAVDDAVEIVEVLRRRFPALAGPPSDDICYATTNRQRALRAVASASDVVLVLGSTNSSNSRRLVEVAERTGTPAYLVDDVTDVDLRWLAGARTVGVTAGASAPPPLVNQVVEAIAGLGADEVAERTDATEDVHFTLPRPVRRSAGTPGEVIDE